MLRDVLCRTTSCMPEIHIELIHCSSTVHGSICHGDNSKVYLPWGLSVWGLSVWGLSVLGLIVLGLSVLGTKCLPGLNVLGLSISGTKCPTIPAESVERCFVSFGSSVSGSCPVPSPLDRRRQLVDSRPSGRIFRPDARGPSRRTTPASRP